MKSFPSINPRASVTITNIDKIAAHSSQVKGHHELKVLLLYVHGRFVLSLPHDEHRR